MDGCKLKVFAEKYCASANVPETAITPESCKIAQGRRFNGCQDCTEAINNDFVGYAKDNEFSFARPGWDGWD